MEERIKHFNRNRIPIYTGIKYRSMAEDQFRFFRGTCHLFYEDLYNTRNIPGSPPGWLCGDLHPGNFGSYKGDNSLVYFDLTDFDEGICAPVCWELARIVTGIFVALPADYKHKSGLESAKIFLESYSAILRSGKSQCIEQKTAKGITRLFLDKVSGRKVKNFLAKRTIRDGKNLSLRMDHNRVFPVSEMKKKQLINELRHWMSVKLKHERKYNILDVGFRIAGTGSVGIERYIYLLKASESDKYLFIDMKKANPSTLQPYVKSIQPNWKSEAERIVAIQQRMQNISPALLSTMNIGQDSYVLKEMQPTEDKIQFPLAGESPDDLNDLLSDLALLTASAQLRSSGRQGSACADELIAFGENDHWYEGVLNYALSYAEQVNKDYRAYLKAYKAGYYSQKGL